VAEITSEAQAYIDAIEPRHRPLFDRLHRLISAAHPEVSVRISYAILAYVVDRQRLYVGAWKHGLSMYGWQADDAADFVERHPEMVSGRGTIRLRPEGAAELDDAELLELVSAALDG
jgi:uncharacterized protein YdhG (YjbR/CyaY superfamily)